LRALVLLALIVGAGGVSPALAAVGQGTLVTLDDGTTRAVEALKRGDKLRGPDAKPHEIFAVTVVDAPTLVTILTDTGRKVAISRDQQLPVVRDGDPIMTNALAVGDKLMSVDGFETVVAIEDVPAGTKAYRLSIGEPGTSERDPLWANGVMLSDEPI
jgi:hypothetical protein